jgi:hypothetical protein
MLSSVIPNVLNMCGPFVFSGQGEIHRYGGPVGKAIKKKACQPRKCRRGHVVCGGPKGVVTCAVKQLHIEQ